MRNHPTQFLYRIRHNLYSFRVKKTLPLLLLATLVLVISNSFPSGEINASPNPPNIIKYFDNVTDGGVGNSDIIHAGQISILRFDLINPNVADTLLNVKFDDQLPPNIFFTNFTPTSNTCIGGTILATNSGSTGYVTINGITLNPGVTCTILFDVTAMVPGDYTNTTNPINADNASGQNVGIASTHVLAFLLTPTITKSFNLGAVGPNGTSTMTITIHNPNPPPTVGQPATLNDLKAVNFLDAFPINGITTNGPPTDVGGFCGGALSEPTTASVQLTNGNISANQTCTITVPVLAPAALGAYPNTIAAHAVTFDGGDNPAAATATLNVVLAPTITKSFASDFVAGQGTTVTFVVNNPGTLPLTNMHMTDNLQATAPFPNNMVVDTGTVTLNPAACLTVSAVPGSNTISITGGTLAAGASCTITVPVNDPLADGPLVNTTGPIRGDTNGTTVAGNQGTANVTVNPGVVAPTIAKTFGAASVNNGDSTTMTLQITNPNITTDLHKVVMSDLLPAGLMFTFPATPTFSGSCGPNPVAAISPAYGPNNPPGTVLQTGLNFTTDNLPANTSCTITVAVTGLTIGGPYTNTTSTVTSINAPPSTTASADLTVVDGKPGDSNIPTIVKTFVNGTMQAGGTDTLRISITNPDTFPIFGVHVTDNLPTIASGAPGNMVVANVSPTFTTTCPALTIVANVDTSSVRVTGGVITAGQTCVINVTVTTPVPGTYNNTTGPVSSTNIVGTNTASATENVTATNVLPATLQKSFPGITAGTPSIAVGDTTGLVITVTNPNPTGDPRNDLINVQFTDTLPTEVQGLAATGGTCTPAGTGTVTALSVHGVIPLLAANTSCTFTFNVKGFQGGLGTNTIPLSTSNNGGDGPASGSADIPVEAPPQITKTFIGALTAEGTTTLRITVSNPGTNPFPLTGIGLTDTLPSVTADPLTQMVVVPPVPAAPGTCGVGASWTASPDNKTLTLTGASLDPGTQCILNATVTGPAAGNYSNVTTKPASDNGGTTGNAGSASITAAGLPRNLKVVKGFNPRTLFVNNVSVMTITITNPDDPPDLQNGVSFVDSLPMGLAYADATTIGATGTEPNLTSTCGGTVTTTPMVLPSTRATLTLDHGVLAALASCVITVDVTSAVANSNLANTVAVTSFQVTTATTASAGLIFIGPPIVDKSFVADPTDVGTPSVLTLTITNPNQTTVLNSVSLTDHLPAGLVVSSLGVVPASCGGPVGTSFTASVGNPVTITFTGGTINAGVGTVCTLTAIVTGTGGTYVNKINPGDVTTTTTPPNDTTITRTLDIQAYSIGNRVWFDTNNDHIIDNGEAGVPNVAVNLFKDANGDGIPDNPATPVTTTTDGLGYYLFDNLAPGKYIVGLDEIQFRLGQPLDNYYSSTGVSSPPAPPANLDSNDNGIDNIIPGPGTGGILSKTINLQSTLTTVGEPQGETDLPTTNPAYGPNHIGNFGESDQSSNVSIDFGLYRPMSIGNRVWYDLDGNGAINGAETGVPGVTVKLFADANTDGIPDTPATALATVTTDANGYYLFDNLTPGDYVVEVAPTNFNGGQPLNGLNSSTVDVPQPGNTTDSRDNGIGVAPGANGILSSKIHLDLGPGTPPIGDQPTTESDFSHNANDGPNFIGRDGEINADSNLTVDFGFTVGQMSLGNRVWLDPDNNATRAASGEPGIAGVKVSLYPDLNTDGIPDSAAIMTTTTDANGYYLFVGLTPGHYVVGLDNTNFNGGQPLNGLISSTGNFNAVDDKDNGHDALNPTYGLLSSTIFMQLNAEPLNEGDPSPQGIGNPVGTGGATDNNSNLTVDFGLHKPMSIGNRVWFDTDNNGQINGLENGIAGVTVKLYADANKDGLPDGAAPATPLATAVTDANGYYLFDGLGEGSYVVAVDNSNFVSPQSLFGLTSSTGAVNQPNTIDSQDNGIDATNVTYGTLSKTITLVTDTAPNSEGDLGPAGNGTHGETDANANLTVDFGFNNGASGSMSLGNRVWIDNGAGAFARDGVQQIPGESGVANVAVELYRDTNGDGVPDTAIPIATTNTDANGYYLFDRLAPGKYIVKIPPTNFQPGAPLDGYGSTKTGTAVGVPARIPDLNDHGIDVTNPGFTGVLSNTITLVQNAAPTLEVDPIPQVTGSANDQNSDLTVDFGFYKPLSVGNRVWFDVNNDGILNNGEIGIPNVTVKLFQGATLIATDITDSRGYYLFSNLFPGTYTVQVINTNFTGVGALVGFKSSIGVQGANVDSTDNGIDDVAPGINGIKSAPFTIAENTEPTGETDLSGDATNDGPFFRGVNGESDNNSNLTIDFGFNAPSMSIGNRVWLDDGTGGGIAGNGIQDGGEKGVAGVQVGLYADANKDGVPDGAALATLTTDANGFYLFDTVPPGNYVVRVEPSNFLLGSPLYALSSTTTTANSATNTIDKLDNGVDSASPGITGILSGKINLTPDGAPTGELPIDKGPQGNGTGINDQNSNLTIDFGFAARFDFGDAPDTYKTLLASNGPRHQIVSNLYLGQLVDAENNGQPNVNANGDDINGVPNDEDGVQFPPFVAGTTDNVGVTVFNNTGKPATVVLWVDLDFSHTFDSTEGFTATVPSSPSPQVVQIPVVVPIGADKLVGAGPTYARVRLSTDALTTSTPTGPASDGEVEDYEIPLINPPGLSITKSDNLNSIAVGTTTTYTITISNSGPDVGNRHFVDTPPIANPNGFDPATLSWTCTAQNGASCVAGTSTATLSGTGPIDQFIDVIQNSTIVYTFTATLRSSYNATTVVNEADIFLPNSATIDVKAQDQDGIISNAPTGVKSGVLLGSNVIRWTMTWTNSGSPQAATITDPIQPGQLFIGNLTCTPLGVTTVTNTCVFNAGTLTWTGTLGTGAANGLQISYDTQIAGKGVFQNVASIDMGGKTAAAAGQVVVGGPAGPTLLDPAITKSGDPNIVAPGGTVTWTITVTNPNPVSIPNVRVDDDIPPPLQILSATTNGGTITTSGQHVAVIIPTMTAGQTVTIVVKTRVSKSFLSGQIDNIAILTGLYKGQADASVLVSSKLPATGEHPTATSNFSIVPYLALLSLIAVLTAFIVLKRRMQF